MDLLSFFAGKNNKEKPQKPSKEAEEDIKRQLKKYEGKSQDELMDELLKSVEEGKANGTFSKEALSQFKSKVAPMLDEAQRKRLDEITDKLE